MQHIKYYNLSAAGRNRGLRGRRRHLALPLVAVAAMVFASCLDEGEETIVLPVPEASIPASVLPIDLQNELVDNGFAINEGTEPPGLEGTFLVSPMQLLYASDGYNPPAFHDLYLTFSDWHQRGAIKYTESQHDSIVGTAATARIVGHGDLFTVCCNQEIEVEGSSWSCTTSTVISGRVTEAGITDLKYAIVLISSTSTSPTTDPSLAPDGTVRIFADGDGTAVRLNQ